jgi:hypothetical protein
MVQDEIVGWRLPKVKMSASHKRNSKKIGKPFEGLARFFLWPLCLSAGRPLRAGPAG